MDEFYDKDNRKHYHDHSIRKAQFVCMKCDARWDKDDTSYCACGWVQYAIYHGSRYSRRENHLVDLGDYQI